MSRRRPSGGERETSGGHEPCTVVLLDGDVVLRAWSVGHVDKLDLFVVEALARLQLAARRAGMSVRLRMPGENLDALIDFVGLTEVLVEVAGNAVSDALRLEPGGKAEGGEQLGEEEVVEPRDPLA